MGRNKWVRSNFIGKVKVMFDIKRLKRDKKKPEAVTNQLPCSTQVDYCVINKHGSVKDDVHEGSSAT